MADPWIKEWRISIDEDYIDVIMTGEPTVELFDRLIGLLTDSRNQWVEERADLSPDPSTRKSRAGV